MQMICQLVNDEILQLIIRKKKCFVCNSLMGETTDFMGKNAGCNKFFCNPSIRDTSSRKSGYEAKMYSVSSQLL